MKNEWRDMRSMVTYSMFLAAEGFEDQAFEFLEKARGLDYKKGRFTKKNVKYLVFAYAKYSSPEQLRDIYESALEVFPADEETIDSIIRMCLEGRDFENARTALSLYNRLFTTGAGRELFGDLYHLLGCYELAEKNYLDAISIQSNNPVLRSKLIQNSIPLAGIKDTKLLFDTNKKILRQGSIKVFEKLFSGSTEGSQAQLMGLIRLYLLAQDFALMEACIDVLLRDGFKSLSNDYLKQVAIICEKTKRYEKANKILGYLYKENQENTDICLMMGNNLMKAGSFAEAEEWFRIALENQPNSETMYLISRKRDIAVRMAGINE